MELEIFKIKDELDGYLQNPNMIAWAITNWIINDWLIALATELTFIISLKSKNKNVPDMFVCSEIIHLNGKP